MCLQLGSGLCLETQNTHYYIHIIIHIVDKTTIPSISNNINSVLTIYSMLVISFTIKTGENTTIPSGLQAEDSLRAPLSFLCFLLSLPS